ncbi:UvrD-helicase domain-containing protein [Brachybacterium sp. GPGPB12]|uniref:UvrD-helicase domain-containing protein n=1 Tax=Brachybacterium sp. GPGPB12 TaxID=3023517 RepID=UPI0031342EDD
MAREVPAAAALARRMHRVVPLDEFQDTSVAQSRMLTDLFGPGHAACAVGDPQQAIYGWRGASAASLAGFADAFATEARRSSSAPCPPPGATTRQCSPSPTGSPPRRAPPAPG